MRRGRFVSGGAAVEAAMARLLELGRVSAASRTADLESGTLHYLETGAGTPVVLLQGAGGGAANWYRVMGPLSARAHVLSPDLPGFGLSSRMDVSDPLGDGVAAILEQWLRALGLERVALVATSFGSLVALRLALRQPAFVERLVLLNGVGLGGELPLPVRLAGLPLVGPAALRPSAAGARWQLRTLLTRPGWRLPAEHEAALVEYLRASSAAGDPRWMSGLIRRFCGLAGQREQLTDAELARIDAPVLVVWGEHDPFLPDEHGRRAASCIPRAVFHRLAGAGHSPNWEAPEALLPLLLSFLIR